MEFDTGSSREETGSSSQGASRGGNPGGGGYSLSDPVDSFVATVRALIVQPAEFFRGVALRDGLLNPIGFAVICALIGAFLGGLITIFAAVVGIGDQGIGGAVGGFVGGLIFTPILTPIGLFIWAGISHLFVMLFVRPDNAGYWSTFRVVSYVSATSLVSWVPILGGLVALVWGVILAILGIREVHSTTTGRAVLVVLVPAAVVLLLFALVAFSVLVGLLIGGR
ncbi:YIP1 family protein [Rubrobacter aplysinae]|uniref:YIP1 family protein n=1 Tax=Rubrobacter aplysinae TaxID=909625 RepID=UPI00064BA973|nr:YIP1 family protein [Rubrobacter aplysinae]